MRRVAAETGTIGSRSTSSQRPSIASTAFTGAGFASQKCACISRKNCRLILRAVAHSFASAAPTIPAICAGITFEATEINPSTRVRDLTDEEVAQLRTYIDTSFRVEGDLRRDVSQDIKRKMEINCYEGVRHRKGLPVHGQRTHTNARTRKGPKKTVAGKKKVKK